MIQARRLPDRWTTGATPASLLALPVAVALAIATGVAVGEDRLELAVALAGGFFGLAVLRRFTISAWCFLLLATTVGIRIVVTTLGLPQALNFAHFGVVAGFALAALIRPVKSTSRAPARWLVGFLLITAASLLASGSHPLRALLFLIIAGEPLVVVWALSRWDVSERERKRVGAIVLVLAAVQLPIAASQAATQGLTDPVQGTLAGHGAGAHILGGLFALCLLVIAAAIPAGVTGLVRALVGICVCLAMMLATGAMAVTVLTGVAVATVPFLAVRTARATGVRTLPSRHIAAVVITVAASIAALSLAPVLVSGLYERIERLVTIAELPEVRMVGEYSREDVGLLLLGSGPGTSASRASTLLVGAGERGHPLAFFGLDPTPAGSEIVSSSRQAFGGSVEAFSSGALAVIGELGLVGFGALILLFWRIWREAAKSDDWLAPAARAALLLTAMLVFIENWLEYPEYAVPLALLMGLVLSRRPSVPSDRSPARSREPAGVVG